MIELPAASGPPPRRGVWFGVDVGTVRVGVARSDPQARLAVPVVTLRRDRRQDRDISELAQLIRTHEAVGVVIGLPLTLAGRGGKSVDMAASYGSRLAAKVHDVSIIFCDERLSSVTAARTLTDQRGRSASRRADQAKIDQVAAAEILQRWLDSDEFREGE